MNFIKNFPLEKILLPVVLAPAYLYKIFDITLTKQWKLIFETIRVDHLVWVCNDFFIIENWYIENQVVNNILMRKNRIVD